MVLDDPGWTRNLVIENDTWGVWGVWMAHLEAIVGYSDHIVSDVVLVCRCGGL